MAGEIIGYIRTSTSEQNNERQLAGIKLDKKFIDKASGKDAKRPQLLAMLDYIREGDRLIVHHMDRLARDAVDMLVLVKQLNSKNISVEFSSQNLTFTGDDSPMSKFMMTVMSGFAELELSKNRANQREGIEIAKKRGIYKGRKPALDRGQICELTIRFNTGENRTHLAKEFGIHRTTLHQYMQKEKRFEAKSENKAA